MIFDVGDIAMGVDVAVSQSSLYCSLHIESGDVHFNMGPEAVLISLQGDKGCDTRHPKLSIAGADQTASLTVAGGIFTDGLHLDGVEIGVGSDRFAVGKLVLTGGIHAEPSTDAHSDPVIRLGTAHDAYGELIIDSSVDLRAFEIEGEDSPEDTGSASIHFTNGLDVKIRSIFGVGQVTIDSNVTLECEEIYGGNLAVGTGGVVLCEILAPSELMLAGDTQIQADGVSAQPIIIEEAGVVISAAGMGGIIQMDSASLIGRSEPMFTIKDIKRRGMAYVYFGSVCFGDNLDGSHGGSVVYPPVGSALPLADFKNFFASSIPQSRTEFSTDPIRYSFNLRLYEEYDTGAVTYFVVNSDERASLLVGQPDMRRADLNFDGVVDFFDIPSFMEFYLQDSPWANIDGVNGVGRDDIVAFLRWF